MKKRRILSMVTILFALVFIFGSSVSALDGGNKEFRFMEISSEKISKDINLQGAIEVLKDNIKGFESMPEDMMKQMRVSKDKLGYTHIKMQQTFDGIPLFEKEYIVHFNEKGVAYAANGDIDLDFMQKIAGVSNSASANNIDKQVALEIAIKETNAGELQSEPEVELFYFEKDSEYQKVYRVRVNFLDPEPGNWYVFIKISNGEVLDKFNAIAFDDATGIGVLGDNKNLEATYSSGKYNLIETKASGTKIKTYDSGNKTFWPKYFLPGDIVTSNDNSFDENRHPAAVDAHVYTSNVYDYYKNKFNRNSIDNSGMDIKSSVHFYENYVNAFWNGNQMVYGDGDGTTAVALCGALDVVAHEITHGVTSYEANLTYQNQSGALNESFSDVFGTLVEFAYQPSQADWVCGEDVWTPNVQGDALRSMEDPTLYNQPDHMDNYLNTSEDNGGVHTNSGIPNKAAYIIMSQIGTDKAEQIYYRALTVYLTSSSNFSACRSALLQSAKDFYGEGSEYNIIVNAFNSVGVY